MFVEMRGKWNTILHFSGLILLMLVLCLPCFAKQTLKQSWGIPVAEGKSLAKLNSTICNYAESTLQQVNQEASAKTIIPSQSNHTGEENALVIFQLKDYLALFYKPYLNSLHILFQQFRI